MGSYESPVIVDERVCVSLSGQHLCSEFPVKSVSEQQSCSKHSQQLIDSNMDSATAPSRWPDSVSNKDTTCLCSGDTTQFSTVKREMLTGENEKTEVLALENLLKNDSGDTSDCLNKNRSDIDASTVESGGGCLNESMPQGEDGFGNLVGYCEIPSGVIPVTGFPINCDQQVDITEVCVCSDIDVCTMESGGEGLKESRLQGEDSLGNLVGRSEIPSVVRPVSSLPINCDQQADIIQVCTVDGDMVAEENEIMDVLALENLLNHDSGDGRGCLNENHNDIDVCIMKNGSECLKESRPQGEDGLGNLVGDCEMPLGVTPVTGLPVNCDRHVDITQVCTVNGDMLAGENEITDVLALENLLKNDSGNNSRGYLNENHSDINVYTMDNGGEYLKESMPQGEDGFGNLVVRPVTGLPLINCDHKVEQKDDISASYLSTEGFMEIMENEVNVSAEGNRELESPLQDCESLELATLNGVLGNALRQKEQDDKSASCVLAEGFMKVMENKYNVSPEMNREVESPLPDCESLELVSLNGVLGNNLKQKEQDIESVCASSLENIGVKLVASVGSADDMCNGMSPLQCGRMFSKVSHVGEKESNGDLRNDRDNCINCLLVEGNSEAVQMESNIEMSNPVSLSTSMENAYKSESPSICVQPCEQISDYRSIDTLTNKWVTESAEDKSNVTTDTKVVGMQMLSIEENACNLYEGSSPMASKCGIDKSGSSQTSQPWGVVDDGSSERLDEPDQLGSGVDGPINSSSPVERYGQTDNQGKDNEKIDCVFETKSYGIVSLSSQRNGRRGKSNRKTQTTKATRKCKITTKVLYPCGSIKIAVNARKKRSCLSKSARSSAWGLLGNVTQLFENSNALKAIQVLKQGSRKSNNGKKSGKLKRKGATIRSQGSRKNSGATSTNIRLKVKMGKEVCQSSISITVPEVVDNSASSTAVGCNSGTELDAGSPKVASAIVDDRGKDDVAWHLKCLSDNPEKAKSCPGAFVNNDLDSNVVSEKLARDGRDYFGVSSHIVVEASGGATDSSCRDPGTSPDSEVINLIPDAQVDFRRHDDFHDTVTSQKELTAPGDLTGNKRGKKKHKHSGLGNSIAAEKSPHTVRINKPKPLKQYGRKQNSTTGISSNENLISLTGANASSNSSSDLVPLHLSEKIAAVTVSNETSKVEIGAESKTPCHLDTVTGLSKSHNSNSSLPAAKTKGKKIPRGKSLGSDSGIKRVNACSQKETQRSPVGKKKTKEKTVCAPKEESQPEAGIHMVDEKRKSKSGKNMACMDFPKSNMLPGVTGEQYLPLHNAWARCDDCHKWRRIPAEDADIIDEIKCTWTCKDNKDKAFADCSIPQEKSNAEINAELELSDASGEEDVSGTLVNYEGLECRRPKDPKKTATCISIRTNQYLHRSRKTQTIDEVMICQCKPPSDGRLGCGEDCLNRVLNIECAQGACPCQDLCSNQQFQKRKYAKLEKFRCGKKGYGLKLLEDISKGQFLIEYVGEVLDMQAYEARQKEYALKGHKHFYFMTLNCNEVIDACIKGNKGRFINHSCDPNCQTEKWMVNGEICIGLFALRDIKKGEEVTFDYNYVRVFGAAAKKCYCGSPQCRGYIGGDPLKNEDYPPKMLSDSDEDYPEPMMLPDDDDDDEKSMGNTMHKASSSNGVIGQISERIVDKRDERDKCSPDLGKLEISTGKEYSLNYSASAVSLVDSGFELDSMGKLPCSNQTSEISQQTENVTHELISAVHQESPIHEEAKEKSSSSSQRFNRTSSVKVLRKPLCDGIDGNRKSKSDTADDRLLSSKAHPIVKTSHSSSANKKGKVKSSSPNTSNAQLVANKSHVLHNKPKKTIEDSLGSRFEAVEEKLNELLDADGGISKRKDAPKGYLKLLYHTAASGDSANGEAIQRNRDLSMILDALLKTKSRVVLNDIINKNGLRMLHQMMKFCRGDFKKIPILRKLLKVLEYLAVREILTSDHINGGPPCPKMESFRESILSLTEHVDKQVHQIARNFRDKWIPKPIRRHGYGDRDENRTEFPRSSNCKRFSATQNNWSGHAGRPSEAIDCVKQPGVATTLVNAGIQEGSSASCAGVSTASGTKTRKRKSRWDQPAWDQPVVTNPGFSLLPHKEQKVEPKGLEFSSLPLIGEVSLDYASKLNREDRDVSGCVNNHNQLDKADTAHDGKQNAPDDVPPGFSSPLKPSMELSCGPSTVCHLKCPFDTVIGQPQEKFISRLPVSYGIPLSIMQQFGTPHAETAGGWVVAPGMPFQPFPPLPPFPHYKDPSLSEDINHLPVNQPAQYQHNSRLPSTSHSNESTPSTTGNQPDVDISRTNNQCTSKRGRGWSHDLGRRYFKQQKWNNTKLGPPWHARRNGLGCMGSSRGGTNSVSIGNITNELRSTYCSENLSCGVEKAGNNCYQHPDHHSQH
ncbi:Methyltransferase [Parasponia andersonii]|uniref:Methyltransferase n=1 Tax=Parasponia andersonii TaxID=3476 RepID=A0A2P5CGG6_PARAD|nr:Methyltransferase [Parasponia andersonii]